MHDNTRSIAPAGLAFGLLLGLLAGFAAGGATPLHAQEYAVTRESYPFFSRNLDIDVSATGPGRVQVIRGSEGRIEVAAHATGGVAAFGLTAYPPILQLTALGAVGADYIVVVPQRTDVRVRVPGRSSWSSADPYNPQTFRWDSVPEPIALDYTIPRPTWEGRFYVVAASPNAPALVRLLSPEHIRSVQLRLEGSEFRVGSSRPLTHSPGSATALVIDPGDEPVDLVVQVPVFADLFQLRLDSGVLAIVQKGELRQSCQPSVRTKTEGSGWRVLYRPSLGLSCTQ
jgi:hypothetical protein